MNEKNIWLCKTYSDRMIVELHKLLYAHKLLHIIIESIRVSNKIKIKLFN